MRFITIDGYTLTIAVRQDPADRALGCFPVTPSGNFLIQDLEEENKMDRLDKVPESPAPAPPPPPRASTSTEPASGAPAAAATGEAPGQEAPGEDSTKLSKLQQAKIHLLEKFERDMAKLSGGKVGEDVLQHVERGDLTCNICRRVFPRTSLLRSHIKVVHQKKGKFLCKYTDSCGKSFQSRQMLKDHLDLAHKHKIHYECFIEGCEKVFGSKQALVAHGKLHAQDEGNFQCEHCQKKFRYEKYLKEHSCKDDPNRQSFKCPRCHRVFYQRKHLNFHVRKNH